MSDSSPNNTLLADSAQVSHSTFFLHYYQPVIERLRIFARLRRDAPFGAPDGHQRLLDTACRTLDLALEVLGASKESQSGASIEYFLSQLSKIQHRLGASADEAVANSSKEIDKHRIYFLERVPKGCWPEVFDAGQSSAAVALDFLTNELTIVAQYVFSEYKWASDDPRKMTSFFDSEAAQATIDTASRAVMEAAAAELEGWCSPNKAAMLHALVRETKPHTIVEIGIYGGRSIVPMACALRENGQGQVYGIETWSGLDATSHRTSIHNDFSWMIADFSSVKGKFLEFLLKHRLHEQTRIIEARSDRCAGIFDSIDMLHIDGGHSTVGAAQDVILYLPRVPPGGIVVYDDIEWSTTGAGLEILRDSCSLLHVVPSFDHPDVASCAVFQKI